MSNILSNPFVVVLNSNGIPSLVRKVLFPPWWHIFFGCEILTRVLDKERIEATCTRHVIHGPWPTPELIYLLQAVGRKRVGGI
jgi:hypothetical protein